MHYHCKGGIKLCLEHRFKVTTLNIVFSVICVFYVTLVTFLMTIPANKFTRFVIPICNEAKKIKNYICMHVYIYVCTHTHRYIYKAWYICNLTFLDRIIVIDDWNLDEIQLVSEVITKLWMSTAQTSLWGMTNNVRFKFSVVYITRDKIRLSPM